jgi:hypothetical protein
LPRSDNKYPWCAHHTFIISITASIITASMSLSPASSSSPGSNTTSSGSTTDLGSAYADVLSTNQEQSDDDDDDKEQQEEDTSPNAVKAKNLDLKKVNGWADYSPGDNNDQGNRPTSICGIPLSAFLVRKLRKLCHVLGTGRHEEDKKGLNDPSHPTRICKASGIRVDWYGPR